MKFILQKVSQEHFIPSNKVFAHWVDTVFDTVAIQQKSFEITIRIVDEAEITDLNYFYRKKKQPTNVLSFDFIPLSSIKTPMLGDIIICAPIVIKEAKEQNKSIEAHFAHLTIHGVLHLLGYDHKKAREAKKMEQQEVAILGNLGYKNPYYGSKGN
jgi:probable rRNA maturation factor